MFVCRKRGFSVGWGKVLFNDLSQVNARSDHGNPAIDLWMGTYLAFPCEMIGIKMSKARSEGGRDFWTEIVSVVSGIIRSYDYTFFPGRCLECFFFGFVFLAGGVWGNRFT